MKCAALVSMEQTKPQVIRAVAAGMRANNRASTIAKQIAKVGIPSITVEQTHGLMMWVRMAYGDCPVVDC